MTTARPASDRKINYDIIIIMREFDRMINQLEKKINCSKRLLDDNNVTRDIQITPVS